MKTWKIWGAALTALTLLATGTAYGAEIGELDTTFGEQGKVVTTFGRFGDQAYAVTLQPDGKIVAAGSSSNGYDFDIAIARYNTDGSLDTSFSEDGKLRTSLGDSDEEITAIGVQDDGYIVAAGYTVIDGGRDFVLIRLTPDGFFDNSFGEGGMVVTEFGNLDDEITALTIDEEGRIVVCGYVTGTAGKVIVVARYRENGDLDIEFGDEGVILADIGDDTLARSIQLDSEGRIVITGSLLHQDRTELMLLRFFENGDFDLEFGQSGIAAPATQERASEGYGLSILEDGRIMIAGAVGEQDDMDSAVFRFTPSGQPDPSFGENGVLITSASKEDDRALSIDVLDNVVGLSGFSTFNTKRDFLFISVEEKLEEEGANVALNLKTGSFPGRNGTRTYRSVFDLDGTVKQPVEGENEEETSQKSVFSTTPMGYTDDVSFAVVLQADGRAVSAGYSVQDDISRFAIARYVTPVARAGSAVADTTVNWIITRDPFDVNRTGAISGGTILAEGITITKRGVVFSTVPNPILASAADGTNPDNSNPNDPSNPDNPGTPNTSPVINITEPAGGDDSIAVGGLFNIRYELTDSEGDSSEVTFYYSTDTSFDTGQDPEACASTTLLTPGKYSCPWDTLNVDPGDYFIFGIADDGISSPSAPARSPDAVTITNPAGALVSSTSEQSVRIGKLVSQSSLDEDLPPQTSSNSEAVESEVDSGTEPLIVSNGSPRGALASGSTMTYIGAYSSAEATCRYSGDPEQDFDAMPLEMATADNISHIARVDGLADSETYTFYVRCRDFDDNENGKPYRISFRVAAEDEYFLGSYRLIKDALGRVFVATAYAQTDGTDGNTGDGTQTDGPTSVFDLTAPAYTEEGFTEDGAGPGSYSSVLENLKPGTFYYVRAYAVDENDKVYYGDQLGFKTADSCFIATAAFGTILHPYVKVLRDFRDEYLVTNIVGRNLVNLYYRYSPPVADYIAARPVVKNITRIALLPVIGISWLILQIGFAGLAMVVIVVAMPSVMLWKSYKRIEIH